MAGLLVWLQVHQGRQVREDQTRPYVIVDFEFRGMLVLVSVRNLGATPAANVRIAFDRPLESPTKGLNPERFAVFSEKQWTQRGRLGVNSVTQAEIDKRDAEYWDEMNAEDEAPDAEVTQDADDQPS